jgi:hypothetical protein
MDRLTKLLLGIIAALLALIAFRLWLPNSASVGRYRVQVEKNLAILVDTTTGRCWERFFESNTGPLKWEEAPSLLAKPPAQ